MKCAPALNRSSIPDGLCPPTADDIPRLLRGDSARTVQIFANLIANSIKFTSCTIIQSSFSLQICSFLNSVFTFDLLYIRDQVLSFDI